MITLAQGRVICPVCGSNLTVTKEQDPRVAWMKHPRADCMLSNQILRVDRRSGYSEIQDEEPSHGKEPT